MKALKKPVFGIRTEWVPVSDLPVTPDSITEIAIDLETRDPNLKSHGPGWPTGDGEISGIAVAYEGFNAYLPIGHEGGGNLDRKTVLKWFQKEIADNPSDKIFHNAAYDVGWMGQAGIELQGTFFDTMLAAPILDENRRFYSLNSVAYDYLGEMKSEALLREAAEEFGVDPKAEMWRLPAGFVGEYAEADARLTLDLWTHFKNLLSRQDLWPIFNLETEVLPICIDMTRKGIRVDLESAEKLKQTLLKTVANIKHSIKKETGVDVELWSAASVAKVFDFHKIPYSRTPTGMPSFTKNFLKNHPHEMAKNIAEARELDKLGNTFLSSIFRYTKNGRIHGHINQLRSEGGGTVSGRVSMSNPNLQQIPARNPVFSGMIRGLFLPEEGEKWASMDYAQQEPRILVHFSSLTNHGLEGSEEFVNAYRKEPKTDFHQMVSEIAKIERSEAKTLNLALMYGMGVNRLAETLDLTVEDAKALMSQYHDKVPFVKELMEAVTRRVKNSKSNGVIRSLLGRKCRFDLWEPNLFVSARALPRAEALHEYGDNIRRAYTYKALNRLIQASAADQTKSAMVAIKREAKRTPLVQIHDELAYSVASEADARKLCEIMENAVQMEVPTPADIKIGDDWGTLHKLP
tara:strand:- start:200 stop:2092 length:1893 start_codon:yes stop_codon:yes gene_type:complete